MKVSDGADIELEGRYTILRTIGRGSASIVFEAIDRKLDRPVAIKVVDSLALDPLVVARFRREVRTLANLSSRNVVAIHDSGDANDVPYIVMEYLAGLPLSAVAGELRGDRSRVVGVLRDVLDGLAAVHGAGVLHRDVKPANVVLRRDGSAVLIDFGLARVVDPDVTS